MLNFDRSTVKHGTVFRIFKMIATSGFLTASECTKFVFGWGSALDPTGGAYSAPDRREREGKEGGTGTLFANSWIRPCRSKAPRKLITFHVL